MHSPITLRFSDMGLELTREEHNQQVVKTVDFNEFSSIFRDGLKFDTGLMACKEGVGRMVIAKGFTYVYYFIPSILRDVQYSFARTGNGSVTYRIWTPPLIFKLKMSPVPSAGEGFYCLKNSVAWGWDGTVVKEDAKVYLFPFCNVLCGSQAGRGNDYICWGDHNVLDTPRNLTDGLYDLGRAFWRSPFNGDLPSSLFPITIDGVRIPNTPEFFQHLEGKDHFPLEQLPIYKTLDRWMQEMDQKEKI